MTNRDLLIDFLNYCQEVRRVPLLDDDNTSLVDDFIESKNSGNTILQDMTYIVNLKN